MSWPKINWLRLWWPDWPELPPPSVTHSYKPPRLPRGLRNPPPPMPNWGGARCLPADNIKETDMPEITQEGLDKLVQRSKRLGLVEDSLTQLKKRVTRHLESTGVEKLRDLTEEHKAALFATIVNDLRITIDHLLDVPAAAPHQPIDPTWKESE